MNGSRRRQALIVVPVLLIVGVCIPWLLQDPNYAILESLPIELRAPQDVELRQLRKLVTRHDPTEIGAEGERYLVQVTLEATNRGERNIDGVRFLMIGTSATGEELCRARAKPMVIDLPTGSPVKSFLRCKDLTEEVVARLKHLTIRAAGATTPAPR